MDKGKGQRRNRLKGEGGKRMKKIFRTLIVLSLLLILQATCYASPPVDGFMGVPWGSGRQQVQKVMEERGFTLLEQRADGIIDKYQGTFVGQPAELTFQYQNDVFFSGEAAFLHVKGQSVDATRTYYMELTGMLKAKYGLPTREYVDASGLTVGSSWEVPTTATPPGQVNIYARYGGVAYGTGYLGSGLNIASGVSLSYDIGSSWARLKGNKHINEL